MCIYNATSPLVEGVCREIAASAKDNVVINATSPIDVFNYVVRKLLGWPREKMLGLVEEQIKRLQTHKGMEPLPLKYTQENKPVA